ncbi:MAG: hypothetical protein WBR32_10795, partial [Pseudolabrys sp.]
LGLSRYATPLHVGSSPLTNGIRAAYFRGLTRVISFYRGHIVFAGVPECPLMALGGHSHRAI